MKSRKPAPESGANPVRRWTYAPVPNKTSTTGWKAGDVFGVETHFSGGSKACRRIMTDSALICPFCESGKKPEFRGYVPFFDADYARRFVLVNRDYFDLADSIERLAMIRASRDKASKAPIIVRQDNWRTTPLPPSFANESPAELLPSLLDAWEDDELRAWCMKQTPVTTVAKTKLSPKDTKDLSVGVLARNFVVKGAGLPPTVDDDVHEVMARRGYAGKPTTNGKH